MALMRRGSSSGHPDPVGMFRAIGPMESCPLEGSNGSGVFGFDPGDDASFGTGLQEFGAGTCHEDGCDSASARLGSERNGDDELVGVVGFAIEPALPEGTIAVVAGDEDEAVGVSERILEPGVPLRSGCLRAKHEQKRRNFSAGY